jgi:type III restriction enzyme
VVVPSTESDFVSSIQKEISSHSVRQVSKIFNEEIMVKNKISTSSRSAVRLLDKLEDLGFIAINDKDMSEIVILKDEYNQRSKKLLDLDIKGCDCQRLKEYFDSFFATTSRVKAKDRSGVKDKGKIKIDKNKFRKFKNLWDTLNYDAIVKYNINSTELIEKSVSKINENFIISTQDIIIKRDKHIEDRHKHDSEDDTVSVTTHSIFTIYEFIKALSNNTKLSIQTIATILSKIQKDKFEQIANNENLALKIIANELISAIYDTIINKISYDITMIEIKNTSLTKDGIVKDFISIGSLGVEEYKINKKTVIDKSIYDENFMEVDSEIEKLTIDQSTHKKITVFAKLPKVNIPTAHGKSYNPDFGYVVEQDDKKELYFIVETKGYDDFNDIRASERLKIASAKAFFKELKKKKKNVEYRTKLNSPELSTMISGILRERL